MFYILVLVLYLESFESLLMCTSACRQAAWKVGYLDMSRGLRTRGSTVIVGQRFEFPDTSSPLGSFPLSRMVPHCLIKLTHRGKSSFELKSTFHSAESSCSVVEHMVKFVYLPKHGVATFPKWFQESYDPGISNKPGPHFKALDPSHICHELFSKTFVILPEHIDLFGHANNEVYIRFIMEAFSELVRSHGSKLSWLYLPLSKVEIYFPNETLRGEVVQVKIFECASEGVSYIGAIIVKEKDSSTALHFKVIFKNNIVKNALKL